MNANANTNRVSDAVNLYAEQDALLKTSNPAGWRSDQTAIELKYQFYKNILKTYQKKPSDSERKTLLYVRREIRRMDTELRPSLLKKLWNHPVASAVRAFIFGNYKNLKQQTAIVQGIEKSVIRDQNLQSLRDELKKAEFNISIDTALQGMIRHGFDSFHIRYVDPLHCKNTNFVLHFEKIPGSDTYYFKQYTASAQPDLKSAMKNDHAVVKQTFSLQNDLAFSAQDAATLVNRRHICKSINGREKWVSLNLSKINSFGKTHLHEKTFDVRKAVSKLPLKNNNADYIEKLISTLKTGASRVVDLVGQGGRAIKCTVKAAPHIGKLLLFDVNNKAIDLGQLIKGAALQLSTDLGKVVNMTPTSEYDDLPQPKRKGKHM
ncbi:hypothetical protein CLV51_11030 [Chitinophaga niastensis]|uniref:Uncharacterized protein n=1 Tax=Chitinophaga niastensis TaxID=536980 RepID=A0A2P8H9D2_CHINA|nr:hypothetical protein [Chitinophaga niastensis]PSL42814.1 hypothetical protein CLV51_11030 [Chitinophaga niastensis]